MVGYLTATLQEGGKGCAIKGCDIKGHGSSGWSRRCQHSHTSVVGASAADIVHSRLFIGSAVGALAADAGADLSASCSVGGLCSNQEAQV